MANVALIIPAYDEAERICATLEAAKKCKLADEIIVVSDGSTDKTAEVARTVKGVRVVELKHNMGKGAAMSEGVAATNAKVIAFIDADLQGLTAEHIDSIIAPVLNGKCEMCVGIFRGGRFWSDTSQIIFPYISGQRAMTRSLFERIPNLREKGYGVEVAIYDFLKRRKDVRQRRVVLRGVSNSYKEKKLGFAKGLQARKQMYTEMWYARFRAGMHGRRRATVDLRHEIGFFDFEKSKIAKAITEMREKQRRDRVRKNRAAIKRRKFRG